MTEWFCGFETGNLNDDLSTGPTNLAIITTSPRFGNFCGQVTASGTATATFQAGYAQNVVPYTGILTPTAPFAMSCAVRVDVRPASASEEILTIQGIQIRLDSAGHLELWTGSTPALQATGTTVLTTGQWYVFELYATNGAQRFRVYPDGSAPVADEFTYSQAMGSSSFSFGKVTNRNGQSMTLSFDDIWIRDGVSGYLGTAHVYLRYGNPNSPIYDTFSKTPSGAVSTVWNDTPSNHSTYASSTTSGFDKQSMAHDPLWPPGTTVTINAVKTTIIGTNTRTDSLDSMRLVGPSGSIVEYDSPIGLQFCPYWSDPWSPVPSLADLNSAQIGVYRHAGSTGSTTIYDCYLQVCYSNLVLPTGGTIQFVVM